MAQPTLGDQIGPTWGNLHELPSSCWKFTSENSLSFSKLRQSLKLDFASKVIDWYRLEKRVSQSVRCVINILQYSGYAACLFEAHGPIFGLLISSSKRIATHTHTHSNTKNMGHQGDVNWDYQKPFEIESKTRLSAEAMEDFICCLQRDYGARRLVIHDTCKWPEKTWKIPENWNLLKPDVCRQKAQSSFSWWFHGGAWGSQAGIFLGKFLHHFGPFFGHLFSAKKSPWGKRLLAWRKKRWEPASQCAEPQVWRIVSEFQRSCAPRSWISVKISGLGAKQSNFRCGFNCVEKTVQNDHESWSFSTIIVLSCTFMYLGGLCQNFLETFWWNVGLFPPSRSTKHLACSCVQTDPSLKMLSLELRALPGTRVTNNWTLFWDTETTTSAAGGCAIWTASWLWIMPGAHQFHLVLKRGL